MEAGFPAHAVIADGDFRPAVVHLDLPIRRQLAGAAIHGIQNNHSRPGSARLINEHKTSANE
jgi:hypothetical protein